ncbi:MAG: hypothetical protein Q4E75_00970 [bacterium]|nr:hypothetical protein [bacterium]
MKYKKSSKEEIIKENTRRNTSPRDSSSTFVNFETISNAPVNTGLEPSLEKMPISHVSEVFFRA